MTLRSANRVGAVARYGIVPHNTPGPPLLPLRPGRFVRSGTLLRAIGFGALALTACGAPSGDGGPGNAPVPLTLENIYRDARGGVFSAAISPDGRWVAAVAESADGRGIHLLDLTEDPPGRAFLAHGRLAGLVAGQPTPRVPP